MLFNEAAFIFGFLPATLLLVATALKTLGRHGGAIVLITASLTFYGWWKASYVVVVVSSIGVNLTAARLIERYARYAKSVLAVGIIFNLALLGYFKYANFFLDNVRAMGIELGALQIILPIGLSFYTFQQIAFIVDTYRRTIANVGAIEYMASVLFFPHLIAGPLVHYRNMVGQFRERFAVNAATIAAGLPIFLVGLTKKLFIADNIAVYVSPIFVKAQNGPVEALSAWVAALGFTTQLYFDFSGYSDMAIGLGLMFGIVLPVNFYSPYKAASIIDFWRRWHISLSEFLRDYLYYPLGGNRKGPARRYINLMIVMLLGGLWHGAAWTFVAWGALHGLSLIVNHGWRALWGRSGPSPLIEPLYVALTFTCVIMGWVLFRAPTFGTAINVFRGMKGELGVSGHILVWSLINKWVAISTQPFSWFTFDNHGMAYIDFVVCAALILTSLALFWFAPNTAQIFGLARATHNKGWVLVMVGSGALMWLCAFSIIGAAPSEFLYFQF